MNKIKKNEYDVRVKELAREIERLVEERDQRDVELDQFREANAGWVERDTKHVAHIQHLEDQLTSARGLARARLERIQRYGYSSEEQTDRIGQLAKDNDVLSQELRDRDALLAAKNAEIVQLTRQCDKNTGIRWTAEDYVLISSALRIAAKLYYDLLGQLVEIDGGPLAYEKIRKQRDRFFVILSNIERAGVKT